MPSVLITGCSSGIGLHSAVAAAQDGWQVFATMRNLEKRGVLDQAVQQAGVSERVCVAQLDVTDRESIDRAIQLVFRGSPAGAQLDAVVHNAAVTTCDAFEDLPEADWRWVLETNFFGVLALTKAVLPAMREQSGGRIVVVTSLGAFAGVPGKSLYCASKWAVEGWAESLFYEVRRFGIQVVCAELGSYKTEILNNQARVLRPSDPYANVTAAIERRVRWLESRVAREPGKAAEAIVQILNAKRPKFRYLVGPDAKAFRTLERVMPFKARAAIVQLTSGMNGR